MAKKSSEKISIDLESLSMDELTRLSTDVQKAMATVQKRRRREAREAMEKVARDFGMSFSDIVGGGAGGGRSNGGGLPAKYRNPENPKQTWSGRGRRPAWYNDALEKGVDPVSLEV